MMLYGALLACLVCAQAGPGDESTAELVLHHCTIDYAQSSSVGANEFGLLQEVFVHRGANVQAGQILGHLVDGEARAQVELAKLEADSDLDLRSRQLAYKQAANRLRISTNLRNKQALSYESYLNDSIAAEVAVVDIELAQYRRTLSKAKLKSAEAHLYARQIVSPHAGVVGEVLRHAGEGLTLGAPVIRIDNPELLLITGKFDVKYLYQVRVGVPVRVKVEIAGADLAIERERFVGKITAIDSKFERATQLCTVVATVENRDRLFVAGLEAVMIVTTSGAPEPAREAVSVKEVKGQHNDKATN